jgi:hypothetical protein
MLRCNIEILIDRAWSYYLNWWRYADALLAQQRTEYTQGIPCRLVALAP